MSNVVVVPYWILKARKFSKHGEITFIRIEKANMSATSLSLEEQLAALSVSAGPQEILSFIQDQVNFHLLCLYILVTCIILYNISHLFNVLSLDFEVEC